MRWPKNSVNHQRIVAFEEARKPGLILKGPDFQYDEIHAYPFWDEVNKQVRDCIRMSPKARKAHNRAAREASLPYRLAKRREIKERKQDWDLPYFAFLDPTERERQ